MERHDFFRNTSLPSNLGGAQNYVDLQTTSGHLELGWEASNQWTVRGGVDLANIRGHWDPAGLYRFAGGPTLDTINTTQYAPFVGFDYDVSANTLWSMDLRYYDTNDNIPANLQPVRTLGPATPSATTHPFSWQGFQVTSQFSVKF